MTTINQPVILMHDPRRGEWLSFSAPVKIITAHQHADVIPALQAIQHEVDSGSRYAAGFISYEAAPAFDQALTVKPHDPSFPLLWFGIFPPPTCHTTIPIASASQPAITLNWVPSLSRDDYNAALARLRDYLFNGDTYQVNYTIRLLADFNIDPLAFFHQLIAAQGAHYSAYLHTGPFTIFSASPELFFSMHDGMLESRPMKGTAPRGLTLDDDRHQAATLQNSEKNRAENIMIVDMIRNDMGRVATPGTVTPENLFSVERYPTVWQMTSAVSCRTRAKFPEIMTALFPCASITGAPKPRTMSIIAELETSPRRIYTGAIGYLSPGSNAQFSVAIRTVLLDNLSHVAEYGVGGGIVWDSASKDEYEECLLKAGILKQTTPPFNLLETIRWDPAEGFFLLNRHLQRLADSAEYFAIPLSIPDVNDKLLKWSAGQSQSQRVRLLISNSGAISIESSTLEANADAPVCVRIATNPIDPANRFLYHKTTNRRVYDEAKAAFPDIDDVILWNTAGEVTESTIANVVVELNGALITPAINGGLLPGTFRAALLEQGKIKEGLVRVEDLASADAIYLINSVRKWRKAALLT
jgi:para-aminobenzoate synthetase/4-amino-4-deoxychorismate lyase